MGILIDTLAFVIIAKILPGFRMKTAMAPFIAAIVYGILSIALGLFALPFIGVAALGLAAVLGPLSFLPIMAVFFMFNVLVLAATDHFLEDFEMEDTKTAVIAAALLSAINILVRSAFS